jgi:hypothetical protein
VGTLPTPEVVYARVTILDLGPIIGNVVRPSFDNVPEWVVIYRNFDFRSLGGSAPDHRGVDASQDRGRQAIATGETALLLISPTTSDLLDAQTC